LFGAGKRLDVIITIVKRAVFCFMSPRCAKGGGQKSVPPYFQNRGVTLGLSAGELKIWVDFDENRRIGRLGLRIKKFIKFRKSDRLGLAHLYERYELLT